MAARIGWALVGASTIADEWMVDAIRAQADATIETVVSGNAARAREFAAKHGIARHSTDLDAVLADPAVHAVYISSTNEKHLPQVLAAARAGKHVLCEKPLALSEADAARMIEACAEHGVILGTNHHLRNASTHRKLRELIIEGAIGTPLFARVFHAVSLPPHLRGWRIEKQDASGGVVLDITVHDVDTLRFVLNAEPIEVSAMTTTGTMSNAGLTDGVMAIVRFDNGVLAQLHDAFTVPFAATGLEVHGSDGSLIAKDVMTQRAVGEIELRDANGVRSIEVEHANLYHTGVAQFHRAIREGQSPAASGVDGYRSLITALAVAQAAQARGHVDVSRRYAE